MAQNKERLDSDNFNKPYCKGTTLYRADPATANIHIKRIIHNSGDEGSAKIIAHEGETYLDWSGREKTVTEGEIAYIIIDRTGN